VAICTDGCFAADAFAIGYRGRDAEVLAVVDCADELEVCGEWRVVGARRERVGDFLCGAVGGVVGEWDEAVGGGEGGADEVLVAYWDVEEGAAAGDVEPSFVLRGVVVSVVIGIGREATEAFLVLVVVGK